jgi:hypothetical protein
MDPDLAEYAEYLKEPGFPAPRAALPRVPRSVPGQPGLYRRGMSGFGDAAAVNATLAQADAKFLQIKANASKLLAMYGPLSTDTITRIRTAIAGKGAGGWYAQMGAAEFSGVIRFFLQGVAYNLSIVHALMNGPNPEAQTTAAVLILTPALGVLNAVDHLVTTAQATEGAIATVLRTIEGTAQSIGQRLGLQGAPAPGLGFEPIEIAAGIVIAFIVVSALYLAFSQYESMQSASDAADAACSRPGVTCTAEQWAAIRDQALQASAMLSILPNLGRAVENAGSLLFWGGLAVVAAAIGYGMWVSAPAATVARQRLTARASSI